MKCIGCSFEIANDFVFCPKCGAKQNVLSLDEQIGAIEDKLRSKTGYGFNKTGRLNCEKIIAEFGYSEVVEAVDISIRQYLVFDKEDKPVEESVDKVFAKIAGICANKKNVKENPYLADAQKLFAYAKKKYVLTEWQERKFKDSTERLFNLLGQKAADYKTTVDEIFWELKKNGSKTAFLDYLNELIIEWEAV